MLAPQSLRTRLALAAAGWVAIAMVAAFFLLSSIFRAHVTRQFYGELADHVEELERINLSAGPPSDTLQARFSDPRYEVPLSGYYWELRARTGVLAASASLDGRSIGVLPVDDHPPGDMHSHRIEGPTGPLLVMELVSPNRPNALTYLVGTDERHLEQSVGEFNLTLLPSLAALGVILVLSVLGFVTFGLAPFTVLANAMRRVRAGEVDSVEGRYPAEVQPLVTELNTLIMGQRESLLRARAQAGNLAHGLKGPLAIIADEAFQLEQKGDRAAAAAITDQCRSMQVHIDHHIARARAQAMARAPGTRSSVEAVTDAIVAALSRLHAASGVAITREVEPELLVALDEQDLNELLANLVDNAFKFAASRITIRAFTSEETLAQITIEDDGPGLPEEARERVFAPGARLDESKPGTGLGLAIVRDLVELYHGTITLRSTPAGGLRVELTLPKAGS